MALHLDYQATLGGAFTEIDLTVSRVGNFVLKIADTHPAVLSFDMVQPQHTTPLALRKFIRFWDDAGTTPDGAAQSSSNPLFEGFIWECQPADSNLLNYVAYDPSHLSGREVPIMSTAWDAGSPPTPGTGAVPRLILNSAIDNDVDYAFERANGQSIGDIVAMVFDDALLPLRWFQAAPAAASAYESTDLSSFVFQPQEKVVSTNESIRAFVDRMTQQHYPEFAFLWVPGARKWRWYSRLQATQVTLTLNDPYADDVVSAMELHRSLEGRYPAIKFYGPEVCGPAETFSTLDSTLNIISAPTVLETATDASGTFDVEAYTKFQIDDVDKRRGGRKFPTMAHVRENDYFMVGTYSPIFMISFDSGSTWQGLESVIFDWQNGTVTIPDGLYPYFWSSERLDPTSSQHFWTPNAYALLWAPYHDPITVRRPASGFSGTSNTVAGQTTELHIYDEMLAVGYNRIGIPVTTATRVAQYEALGDAMLAARQDIIYAGGCKLEGLRYSYCRLNRRVNIAAVDENGDTITTGWEAINAIVTDVEYNFADQLTTLTFSQEALMAWGDNVDLLKERLRVGLVEKIRDIKIGYVWGHFESTYSNKPGGYNAWVGMVYTDTDFFYDSNLGTIEEAL
jgi:hypothetical protein